MLTSIHDYAESDKRTNPSQNSGATSDDYEPRDSISLRGDFAQGFDY